MPSWVTHCFAKGLTAMQSKVNEIATLMKLFRRSKLFVVDGDNSMSFLSTFRQFRELQTVAGFHLPPVVLVK
jgi:hypothetical protein